MTPRWLRLLFGLTIAASLVVGCTNTSVPTEDGGQEPVDETRPVEVTVVPDVVVVVVGGEVAFSASVVNAVDSSVSWLASCGSIVGSGSSVTFVAPELPGSCTVSATSVEDPSADDEAEVTVVLPPPKFIDIAAGERHSLSLDRTGRVWSWGRNRSGQLGLNICSSCVQTQMHLVDGPEDWDVQEIDAGRFFSLASDANHNVWGWGGNDRGQLGIGSTDDQPFPTPGGGLLPLRQFAAGGKHVVAADPGMWAWGAGDDGQLGIGSTTESSVFPVHVDVPDGVTFVEVGAGLLHSVALDQSGRAWAWGTGADGRLGDGTGLQFREPVQVDMPPGVTFTAVTAGWSHSLALDEDGVVWAWGDGERGQLGTGSREDARTPQRTVMPSEVTFVSIHAGGYHSLALTDDGRAWAWGDNDYGQLGGEVVVLSVPRVDSGIVSTPMIPVRLPAGVRFTALAAGSEHSLALDQFGEVWAWGRGDHGQLGLGGLPRGVNRPQRLLSPDFP